MKKFDEYTLEISLAILIVLTCLLRSFKKDETSYSKRIIKALNASVVGAVTGVGAYSICEYFVGFNHQAISFLVGYFSGMLGERLLELLDNKLDLVFSFLEEYVNNKLGIKKQ